MSSSKELGINSRWYICKLTDVMRFRNLFPYQRLIALRFYENLRSREGRRTYAGDELQVVSRTL